MPTVVCPVPGFEQVEVSWPDEWLMGHIDKFYQGYHAIEGAPSVREICGTIALCDQIKGLEIEDVRRLPLRFRPFFKWLVDTVYVGSYLAEAAAIELQKKS